MAKNKNHHLFKRKDTWYFRKKVSGELIKKALGESVTEARKLRDQYLKEILIYGDIQQPEPVNDSGPLFGELAKEWIKIKEKEIKSSTLRDYRSSMNYHILPGLGNIPIEDIGYLDIKKFVGKLSCSAKRINNVLVPLRSLFEFAQLSEFIEKNPMDLVKGFKVEKPDIHPLSMEEVNLFLDNVSPRYKNFFIVAFFTGMRFGEMSALKWKNVYFKLGVIKVRETRVRGEEGRPKTKKSVRDITMLPPVVEALRDQRKSTMGKSEYVFLNQYGRPLLPDTVNEIIWKPALKKAGLEPRSLYQTRHTFATLMLDAGELPGWVQQMMGHETLQMIHEKYYSHIKNYQRDDGSAFMEKVYKPRTGSNEDASKSGQRLENCAPNVPQAENGKLVVDTNSPKLLKK
ncbi:MAG: site-specific integrase [Deltaproteobacteria bacterium]|nr:site-specific integrase [Deltaproteobacteria bacterium]